MAGSANGVATRAAGRLPAGPARDAALRVGAVLERLGWVPDVAVVLGSGLAGFEDRVAADARLPYDEVGLPGPGVAGHRGELVLGGLRGRNVAVLSGRVHYYEGHDLAAVTAATRVLAAVGTPVLLLSNAAGALNPAFAPGDLMVITDHVNLMGVNPLRGPNADGLGPRFPDMTEAYDRGLRAMLHEAGGRLGIRLREGVYVGLSGPSYETPAEIRAFRALGGDAVGMSTVPEVIAARHAGMRVGAMSCITNLGAGLSGRALSHDEVKEVGASVGRSLAALFEEVIGGLP
jgi:purine-nucleoside phosphorylase